MYLIFLFLLTVKSVMCAKILAIVPSPYYSHQNIFRPIWSELSLRGHQVTLITTNPMNNTTLTNLTEIDVSFTNKLIFEDHQLQHLINTQSNILLYLLHVFFIKINATNEQLKHPQVEKLIRSNGSFDVIIVEAHVPAWFGLLKKFHCPMIIISSLPASNFFKSVIGNMNSLVYNHNVDLPFGNNLNFFQRLFCVIFEIFDGLYTSLFYIFQESIIRKVLRDSEIILKNTLKNVSLMITNEIPGFSLVSTNVPSLIHTNGLQINPPQELPTELKYFLDDGSQGVIYFSLGSNVKSRLMPEEKKSIFFDVFAELPYKVVWKFEETVINLPRNVKVLSWVPQQDILRHKNTKIFITQGGLQSIDEAIRFKVPILGVPFFGDQFYNVMRVKELKLGSLLYLHNLTRERLKEMILEIVDNKTYSKNLNEMSLLREHPMKSLENALWWIEYVIRHPEGHHMRGPLADMSLYQYYLLDVGAIVLILFILSILIFYSLIKIMCRKLQR